MVVWLHKYFNRRHNMKRILCILTSMICLCLVVVNASDNEFIDAVKNEVKGDLGDGEKFGEITINDKTLCIKVSLNDPSQYLLPIEYVIEGRVGSITDSLLEMNEYNDFWNTVIIDFGIYGKVQNHRVDAVSNGYNKYFELSNYEFLSPDEDQFFDKEKQDIKDEKSDIVDNTEADKTDSAESNMSESEVPENQAQSDYPQSDCIESMSESELLTSEADETELQESMNGFDEMDSVASTGSKAEEANDKGSKYVENTNSDRAISQQIVSESEELNEVSSEAEPVISESTESIQKLNESDKTPVSEKEILFRGIPWGTKMTIVQESLSKEGKDNARGLLGQRHEMHNLRSAGIDYSVVELRVPEAGDRGWFYNINLAGYTTEETYTFYIYPIENGQLVRSEVEAEFYFGYYLFRPGALSDYVATYDDLKAKLSSIYGEGVETEEYSAMKTIWTDKDGNKAVLRRSLNYDIINLGYIAGYADERLLEAKAIIDAEALEAERIKREQNADNTTGL